jgi:hypothetical protein
MQKTETGYVEVDFPPGFVPGDRWRSFEVLDAGNHLAKECPDEVHEVTDEGWQPMSWEEIHATPTTAD